MIIETKLNDKGVYEPIIDFVVIGRTQHIEAEEIDFDQC